MTFTATQPIDAVAQRQVFVDARSQNGWLAQAVPEETLRALYDLVHSAPTSM